jgi:hypothetical protein
MRHEVRSRFRRRARQRGAVLFIVAMTLAVLASLGMYALAQTQNEMKTSGYARQASQTHYLSEYGVLGATQDLGASTAQVYLGLMRQQPDTSCLSLPKPTDPKFAYTQLACRRMGSKEIGKRWVEKNALPATGAPLGHTLLTGDFFVELTDPVQAQPPPGYDLRLGLCFAQFTISAVGMVQPNLDKTDTAKELAYYGNQGLEMARARVTAGPIRCQQ